MVPNFVGACQLQCFDLSKAYKQIAVSQGSLQHAVLGARDASGKWHMYTSQSLPFGAISSVYAFNKSARALQHLLLEDFSVVTTNYFDDFPTLELRSAGDITTGVVSQFFQLIGWRHAVTGKKAKPNLLAALLVRWESTMPWPHCMRVDFRLEINLTAWQGLGVWYPKSQRTDELPRRWRHQYMGF